MRNYFNPIYVFFVALLIYGGFMFLIYCLSNLFMAITEDNKSFKYWFNFYLKRG